jgi:hypothetical protein
MMREKRALVLVIASLLGAGLAASPLAASEYTRGGTFILPAWDARGAALGGAATILIRDERSAYWNPANLVFLRSARITAGTMEPVPGLDDRYSIICAGIALFEKPPVIDTTGIRSAGLAPPARLDSSAAVPAGRVAGLDTALALAVAAARDTTLIRRTWGFGLIAAHLGLELAQGSSWSENTFGASAAFAPTRRTAVGVTVRVMRSATDAADADAWGAAFDAGVVEQVTQCLWLAVTGKNLLSHVRYPARTDTLDVSWNLAVAYRGLADRVSIECDAVVKYGVLNRLLAGVEVAVVPDLVYLLGGSDIRMSQDPRVIPSAGFATSYRFAEIALSESFDPESAFGRQTRVSISFFF